MKIVYVIDSLSGKGGAERIIINKMEYLVTHLGYEAAIITCYQDEETPNAYPISDKIPNTNTAIHTGCGLRDA